TRRRCACWWTPYETWPRSPDAATASTDAPTRRGDRAGTLCRPGRVSLPNPPALPFDAAGWRGGAARPRIPWSLSEESVDAVVDDPTAPQGGLRCARGRLSVHPRPRRVRGATRPRGSDGAAHRAPRGVGSPAAAGLRGGRGPAQPPSRRPSHLPRP